jgi:hypothetical protein
LRYCDYSIKPLETDECDSGSCSQWVPSAWGDCSAKCGPGIRTRKLFCENNGKYMNENSCNSTLKPISTSECTGTNCAVWKSDDWSQCTVTCGDGLQTRNVYCSNLLTNDLQSCVLTEKPLTQRICQLPACPKYIWKSGPFSNVCKRLFSFILFFLIFIYFLKQ